MRALLARLALLTTLLTAGLGAGIGLGASPASASEGWAWVGGCALTNLSVTYSAPLPAVPGARNLTIDGVGTCAVNGAVGTVTLSGGASSAAMGCHAGVALGAATFQFNVPGFVTLISPATIAVVNKGGVFTLAASYQIFKLAGAGEFVQNPAHTATCPLGGLSSTTWTGAFVFEDPDPPLPA